MKLRNILIVVSILAVLSGFARFANRYTPPPPADSRLGQSLVDRNIIEKAAKLRFTDQGKIVTLARQSDGTWRVASYYDLPADFQKLSGLIGNLTDAKVERLVTSSADRIARLEFKNTKISLLDSTDEEVWTVTLGKNPETGAGRFVRFGSEQKAFLASLSTWLDIESKNWAYAELLNLKADDIAKVEIPFPEGGTTIVSRAKKEDAWTADQTPAGQKVKSDKIASLVGSIGNIRFTETSELDSAAATAAKSHTRAFKLITFDGKTITVSFARKPEEKKIKPPIADPKVTFATLGTSAGLATKPASATAAAPTAKPPAPEYETIPAGPVFVFITNSDATAPVNGLMSKRAFQISDSVFTGLPLKTAELFEPAPPSALSTVVPQQVEPPKKP